MEAITMMIKRRILFVSVLIFVEAKMRVTQAIII